MAGVVGGMWCYFPGVLKARLNVDEIVTTIMLNYVAILTYQLSGQLSFPAARSGECYVSRSRAPGVAGALGTPLPVEYRLLSLQYLPRILIAFLFNRHALGF